jgi:hypothetical protein
MTAFLSAIRPNSLNIREKTLFGRTLQRKMEHAHYAPCTFSVSLEVFALFQFHPYWTPCSISRPTKRFTRFVKEQQKLEFRHWKFKGNNKANINKIVNAMRSFPLAHLTGSHYVCINCFPCEGNETVYSRALFFPMLESVLEAQPTYIQYKTKTTKWPKFYGFFNRWQLVSQLVPQVSIWYAPASVLCRYVQCSSVVHSLIKYPGLRKLLF